MAEKTETKDLFAALAKAYDFSVHMRVENRRLQAEWLIFWEGLCRLIVVIRGWVLIDDVLEGIVFQDCVDLSLFESFIEDIKPKPAVKVDPLLPLGYQIALLLSRLTLEASELMPELLALADSFLDWAIYFDQILLVDIAVLD